MHDDDLGDPAAAAGTAPRMPPALSDDLGAAGSALASMLAEGFTVYLVVPASLAAALVVVTAAQVARIGSAW